MNVLRTVSGCFVGMMSIFMPACAMKDAGHSSASDSVKLPVPEKISRRGSGFAPVSYRVEVDLVTGELKYDQEEFNVVKECKGTLNISQELAVWKQAVSHIEVCFGENSNPVSDGFVDSLKLHYPKQTQIPAGVKMTADETKVYAEILETYNSFVSGNQQFICGGAFEIDRLIKSSVSCLSLD